MIGLTAPQARKLIRKTRNPEARETYWRFLREDAERRRNARLGIVVRPADFRRHQHDFHQWVIGYVQCVGCGLRLPDTQVAA